MERLSELKRIFENLDEDSKTIINPLLDNVIFYENRLKELRELPHLVVNPKNNKQQKATPAAKLYKEYTQQYINIIKVLISTVGNDGDGEDSPLREYLKSLKR